MKLGERHGARWRQGLSKVEGGVSLGWNTATLFLHSRKTFCFWSIRKIKKNVEKTQNLLFLM